MRILALKKPGVFPDNEPIWVVGNILDKQAIEDGFNRKAMAINNLDDLITAVEKSILNSKPRASLLIMSDIPSSLKSSLEEFRRLVNTLSEVNVYEIGRGDSHVVDHPIEYGTLNALIAEARGLSRTQYITDMDPSDKQKQVMLTLDEDLAIYKDKLKESLTQIVNLNTQTHNLQLEIADLKAKLSNNSEVKMEAYRETIERLESMLSRLESDLHTEKKKSAELSSKYADVINKNIDLNYTIEALKNKIEKADALTEKFKQELKAQNQLYNELQTRMSNLAKAQVDKEQYVMLSSDLDRSKKLVQDLEAQLNEVRIQSREKDIDIQDLNRELDKYYRDELTQTVLGRTAILDKATLTTTDLIYIKIVNELPYFRLALTYLFEEIQERYDNKAKLLILKNDDGLDSYLFNGLNIYADLNSIPRDAKMARLHPNIKMFMGIEKLEESTDCLVVVDYIQNNEYYLSTKARETVMTMVRDVEMMSSMDSSKKALKFHGSPLTLGVRSIFDLEYDPRIASAGLPTTRHLFVKQKAIDWASVLNIRGN